MVLLRIVYWISFVFVIAAVFGSEESMLNPTEEGVAFYATMGIIFAVIGGLALARNIKIHGWNRYEISTIFTSVVFGISSQCFPSS